MTNKPANQGQSDLAPGKPRFQVEEAIRSAQGDTCRAAIEVCALLEDEFGLGEEGHFDDDPELISRLLNRQ